MSLSSLLSIARSALAAHQRSIDVTAHNIANAQTPGYSRQRADLVSQFPLLTAQGPVGRGVTVAQISSARDRFLDATYRLQSGLLGDSSSRSSALGDVENAMNEPSDSGIGAALDNLFKSFGDLANDPTGTPTREAVRAAASRLVSQVRGLDQRLGQIDGQVRDEMTANVNEVNDLARRIAQFNTQILATRGTGGESPDLEDQRGALMDRLSQLVGVRAMDRPDGTMTVLAGDVVLVDAGTAQSLDVRANAGGGWVVGLAGTGSVINPQSGSLKGLVDISTIELPKVRAQLDQFAASIVGSFNALHETGFTLTGNTNVDFFDPAGTTAGTIALSADVTASTDNIAAAGTNVPGDNAVALQLAALSDTSIPALGNATLGEYWIQMAAGVGTQHNNADLDTTTNQALVDSAFTQREGVAGVSIDEEMSNLIQQQQAYQAAARLLNVADQMAQTILDAFPPR
jgi:flagellar hook-associated protein 1 FlgK